MDVIFWVFHLKFDYFVKMLFCKIAEWTLLRQAETNHIFLSFPQKQSKQTTFVWCWDEDERLFTIRYIFAFPTRMYIQRPNAVGDFVRLTEDPELACTAIKCFVDKKKIAIMWNAMTVSTGMFVESRRYYWQPFTASPSPPFFSFEACSFCLDHATVSNAVRQKYFMRTRGHLIQPVPLTAQSEQSEQPEQSEHSQLTPLFSSNAAFNCLNETFQWEPAYDSFFMNAD